MTNRVLVRPGTTRWIILARLLGPAAVITGVVLQANQVPAGLLCIAGGIILALSVEAYAYIKNRRRRWVEDLGAGFRVIDSRGEREFSDQQVTALSLYENQKHSEGTLKSVTRFFIVWTDAEPKTIEMQNVIPVGHPDPLSGLVGRMLESFEQRCEFEVQQGREIQGDGWSLSHTTLSIGKPPTPKTIPIDQISAVDIFENKLCIWRHGEEGAFAKFPLNTRNVHMLHVMLAVRLQPHDDSQSAASGESLGRILFERGTGSAVKAIMWFLTVIAIAMGGLLCFGETIFIGVPIVGIGLLLALAALHLQKAVFRCQEYGVFKSGLFGAKRLRYVDVESFTYGATRQYYNGAYTGTTLVLNFKPAPGIGTKAISYSTSVQAVDDDLENLRDHISHVVAARMREQFAQFGQVQWTANITILTQGIQFKPSGFFGRKEAALLPWERYNGFDTQQGKFHIFEVGNPKSVMQEDVSQPNFFPGFYLLLSMFEKKEESST